MGKKLTKWTEEQKRIRFEKRYATMAKKEAEATEPEKPKPATDWWVHVRNSNSEAWFEAEPINVKSLHVFLIHEGVRWWEETRTNSLPIRRKLDGPVLRMEPVTPRGVGWKLYADNGDHSVWRRRRQPRQQLRKATTSHAEIYPPYRPPGSGRYRHPHEYKLQEGK